MEIRRRGLLDDVKRGEICAILAVGCTRKIAARYVGCHPDTIRNTADRDPDFDRALCQAESKHEILHLAHINSAAKEGRYWRAAAWALERKYPQRYAAREPHTLTMEQVSDVRSQFAAVVIEEVADQECHERILTRLAELTAALQASAPDGGDE